MSEKNTIRNCEECENSWQYFQCLSKAELELINQNRYEATFKPGEIILKQGAPASNVLFLAKGLAKNYIEGLTGKNFVVDILLPGILVLSPGAYVDSRYTYSVAAITQVNACFISFEIFRQLVRANGEFAESLLENLSVKSLRNYLKMVNLAQKKMSGRIADALLYFSDEVFKSDEFDMILSRQELGEMTNMVKESVVRILKEMEDEKIIFSTCSMIRIADRKRLIEISEQV